MRLIDCFSPLISYVAHRMDGASQNPPVFETFQDDVDRLLARSEEMGKGNGFAPGEYDSGRFAVCAWVDEAVLCSVWPGRERWEKRELQMRYYGTNNAGQEFFERLSRISPRERDVMEVYAACLVMGFKGKYYGVRDIPELETVSQKTLAQVMEEVENPFSSEELKFFPAGYLGDKERPKKKLSLGFIPLFLLAGSAAAVVAALVFFILDSHLNRIVEMYFRTGL